MKAVAGGRLHAAALATMLALSPVVAAQVAVTGGPALDYQASVVQPWGEPGVRIVVFERLTGASLLGDLWVTRSEDSGATWSLPSLAVGTAANERHAALVQTAEELFQLFYLKDEGGPSYRIHRASSTNGVSFIEQGRVELGWASAGEINPHVIRQSDGTLLMTYHRLGGASYIAASVDGGLTWDEDRVQISQGNAALPRLAYRESDRLYLAVYQTNPGNNQLQLWARTSDDAGAWIDPPVQITSDGNNHDALPFVLEDDRFALLWARVADGHFQIFSMGSGNGLDWAYRRQLTRRQNLANVQPHALAIGGGVADVYWGAAQDGGGSDYDIVRQTVDFDELFGDGFEP
ncbi:MAG TPA: sialidase family protein [Xanthomonadaceae bacterium]|nr:sialidase family protein [Xanthomonadaceae bacterium]